MATLEFNNDDFLQHIRSCDDRSLLAEARAYEHIKYARFGKVVWSAGTVIISFGVSSPVAIPYAAWASYESYKAVKRCDDCAEQLQLRGLAGKKFSIGRKAWACIMGPVKP